MNIMENAQKRAIIQIDTEYVFNDIYFGEEGMTSTSANHVSAMANVMAQDIKNYMKSLQLYKKSIRVIGEEEVTVERVNNTLPSIQEGIKSICKCNALIAWLREAVKEREAAQEHIRDMTLDTWLALNGIEKPTLPIPPKMPTINFRDYATILDAGLTVKEYNRFLELNSSLAVYGEVIHSEGLLTRQKAEIQRIFKKPVEVNECGRDTIITTYKFDEELNHELGKVYTKLQAEYRKLQAEKNGIEEKFAKLSMDFQTKKLDEWRSKNSKYELDLHEVNSKLVELDAQMKEWKKQRLEDLASLKIIIPNDLKQTYEKLKEKYL